MASARRRRVETRWLYVPALTGRDAMRTMAPCGSTARRRAPLVARAGRRWGARGVRMSIRHGFRPSMKILSGVASSSTSGATAPKPKSSSASRRRFALAVVGSTNRSRSSVSLGSPWPATACPPTSTNLTRRAISTDKNSVQSRLSSIFTEPFPPQTLDGRDALLERHRRQIFAIRPLRFAEAAGDTHDALDHTPIVARRNVRGAKPRSRGSWHVPRRTLRSRGLTCSSPVLLN